MKPLTKGKILRWTMVAVAIYVVLAFFDVVPMSAVLKNGLRYLGIFALVLLALFVIFEVIVSVSESRGPVHIETRLHRAHTAGDRKTFDDLLNQLHGGRGLKVAAELGECDLVKQLIARGVHPDDYPEQDDDPDDSALIRAVGSGSMEIVQVLIEAGADVNRATNEAWNKTIPLAEAITSGHQDIARLLLTRGADHRVLLTYTQRGCSVDESVTFLLEIGENARAQDLTKTATGIELCAPDSEILERAGEVKSAFVTYAERFKAQGDYARARRLCEWKIDTWKRADYYVRDCDSPLPLQMSICQRLLGEMEETENHPEEAVKLYRHALATWQASTRISAFDDSDNLPASFPDEALQVISAKWQGTTRISVFESEAPEDASDEWLQVMKERAAAERAELVKVLRGCERILGRFGRAEEQARVVATRAKLEET